MNENQHAAETSVLGAILQEPDLIDECYLQPEEFELEQHQLIMKYMRFLNDIDKPIDLVVMAEHSGQNLEKIGGIQYLVDLQNSVPTTSNMNHYQEIIRKSYIRRRTYDTLSNMAMAAQYGDDDVKEFVVRVQESIDEIAELSTENGQGEIPKMADLLLGHEKKIAKRQEQKGLTGAKTASLEMDRMTGGHQNQDLTIIAARPSMGKTAYVINDMIETAKSGKTPILFSLEMSGEKISERAMCILGNIDSARLRTGNFGEEEWQRWNFAMTELNRLPIYIDDTPGITVQEIAAKVKRMKKKHSNLVVYIDYLQLISPGRRFDSEHQGVAYVSKMLKQIARRNDCPVVAISAVGRKCEERQNKRPLMSDLRDSGSIESDADVVIFLYRDEYYNKESEKKGIVELILAKGRNIGVGTIEMVFNAKTGKFLNIDRKQEVTNDE